MQILILTSGSRGDVQPYVALGQGLKASGHDVTVCTSSNFEGFITDHGLDYAYMNDALIRFIQTGPGHEAIEASGSLFGWIKKAIELSKTFKPVLRRMLDEQWEAVKRVQPDAIVFHPKAFGGYHIMEKRRIPGFFSLPIPMCSPTTSFPQILFPDLRLGGWYNLLTYKLFILMGAGYRSVGNTWRKDVLGLPPASMFQSQVVKPNGDPMVVLYCYSPQVFPPPPDWPDTTVATGYWFLDTPRTWTPPEYLERFLTSGPPPVYVGFGSISGKDARKTAGIVVEALHKAGQRGILSTGWGGLDTSDVPEDIIKIASVPHDYLFDHVAAVVHHGGAGTTAAGLRAGKPTVICPFFGDQPFWGRCVSNLGAGPRPIPQKRLTAENLANAVKIAATDPEMKKRAADLGTRIRAENGVAKAVDIINLHLS